MAGGLVAGRAEGTQGRLLGGAQVLGGGAAGAEAAAGRGSDGGGEFAAHTLAFLGPFGRRVGDRDRVDEAPRVVVRRSGVHLACRADLDQLAEVHDADRVGHVADHGQVVGDEQVRQAAFAPQFLHQVEDLGLDGHVQGGYRLVGHDHRRAEHQGPRQSQALPLAAGELVRVPVGGGPRQPHLIEDLLDPLPPLRAGSLALNHQRLGQDRPHPHPGIHSRIRVLEHQLDAAGVTPPLPPRHLRQVFALDQDRSAGRFLQPHDQPPDRRLPAARLADEAERRSFRHAEADVRDGGDRPDFPLQHCPGRNAEALFEVLHLEQRAGRRRDFPPSFGRWDGGNLRQARTRPTGSFTHRKEAPEGVRVTIIR